MIAWSMGALPEYVVFDLETNADRSDPAEHEIIQIGAVSSAAVSGRESDRFEILVRPERRPPARITELTGLEYGDLAGAPPPVRALREFFNWVRERPLIAHNGFGYDFEVLDAAAGAVGLAVPAGPRLDTLELAHLVYPRAGAGTRNVDGARPPPGRSLDNLTEWFGLAGRDRHEALGDARLTRHVMLRLLEEMNGVSPRRRLQRRLLGLVGHPWSLFLDPHTEATPLEQVVPRAPRPPGFRPTGLFDADRVARMFEAGGALMTGGRTPRPQQAEMARLVSEAFANGGRHMIEAPTGTGKTLAYLVPAIEMARASGRTAVITPHSRVLQDQILVTLEDLESELAPFSKVVLKGRQNYVSLKALESELAGLEEESEQGPAPHPVAMSLAILCGWVAETPSGDWADLRTRALESHLRSLPFFRWKLRVEDRPGPVRDSLDELDFYRRARNRLRTAHVAVLNHALLATGPDLRADRFDLVIDEAHGLEDSVTAAATLEVSGEQLERLCDALWDGRARRGLAVRLATATGWGLRDPRINGVRRATGAARTRIARFSTTLTEYVRDRTGALREQAARYGVSYRIRSGVDTRHPNYRAVLNDHRAMTEALRNVVAALDEICVPEKLHGRYRRDALEDEVARLGGELWESIQLIGAVLRPDSRLQLLDDDPEGDDVVEWINIAEISFETANEERDRSGAADGASGGKTTEPEAGEWRWALRRAPLSVAGLLAEIWERSHSVVLTSATLRSGDSFSYLIGRLGLGSVESNEIDSPFDNLSRQHLLLLTDYLPAPRGQLMDRFTQIESTEIPRLCATSDGSALVLMTARARLHYVRDHARSHLDSLGIELMAQGDASSQVLVERMKADPNTCLLGMRSFWEGIDLPGDALRLLVIEKVPFDSIGDPVVSARMDLIEMEGRDPFADYMAPRAAIAFAQGVGRLIRTAHDIGVTVVLDNRLCRPVPYRDMLLGRLSGPPTIRTVATPAKAYAAITGQLGLELDEDRWERINRIPGIETLSQAALQVDDGEADGDEAIHRRLEKAREWLGFSEWRPGQQEVMTRFMRGEDVMAVMPTGSGKSVMYQIPALVSPGVTLVVSPLIALMRDQVDNLRARGVTEATAIYSGVGQAEQEAILRGAASGHIKLLFVSPERLWSPVFRSWLAEVDVARIAVDEAHCISMWGHSFRPEYTLIPRAISRVIGERTPVLAVTATATREVRDDIVQLLGLSPASAPLVGSVDRPEIRYYVERCRDRKDRDLRVVRVVGAFRRRSAIVYVPTRKDTTRLSALLRTFGHRVRPYSGAMEKTEREHTEDAFRHGEIDVVVATKAFGLGIDKPDIALIVHLEMPASIEEYVQETGRVARGARDGTGPKTGTAVLMVTPRDCRIHRFFVKRSAPELEDIEKVWTKLRVGMNRLDPAELAGRSDTEDGEPDQSQVLALHYLDRVGAIRRHRDFVLQGRVSILDSTERRLDDLRIRDPELARKAGAILDLASARGGEYRGLDREPLPGMSPGETEATLLELQKIGVCGFTAWKYGWTFERPAGSRPDRIRLRRLIDGHRRRMDRRAERARNLARGAPRCRRREMLRYLGDPDPIGPESFSCGGCDACTPGLPRPWRDTGIDTEQIEEAAREGAMTAILVLIDDVEGGGWSRRNLVRTLRGDSGGPYPLAGRLQSHRCFGRLGMLGAPDVESLIDELMDDGYVDEADQEVEGRSYSTLRLTEDGRRRLR